MGEVVKSEGMTAAGERVLGLIRKEFPGYHPLMAIAQLAHSEKVKDDPRLELECHKTLVKYVTPELKSVEVKAEIQETRRVIVSMFDGGPVDLETTPQVSYDRPQIAVKDDPMWKSLEVLEELAA